MGVAGLQYTPEGRINLMLIWLLWCGLPFLGACVSGVLMFRKHQPPWLIRFAKRPGWQVDGQFLMQLWFKLHQLWCLVGFGILLSFLILLLFTDLAFGWSSTLITDPHRIHALIEIISFHWQAYWPAAVPSAELIESTRFVRISQNAEGIVNAGDWWPFLLASLLTYNLLPRCLLMMVCLIQLRDASSKKQLSVSSSQSLDSSKDASLQMIEWVEEPLEQWKDAHFIYWEVQPSSDEALVLGVGDWIEEQAGWHTLLTQKPERIVWHVDVRRSPLAELADKVQHASANGIHQAICVIYPKGEYPPHTLQSWQSFAKRQQLVWLLS